MKNKKINPEISSITNLLNSKYDGNEEIFQEELKNIKPFRNIKNDVPLSMLEKLIYKYELKYAIMVNYICPVFIPDNEPMFSATIRDTKTKKLLPTIYGGTIYELFCKICLYYYLKTTITKEIGLKEWNKKYES